MNYKKILILLIFFSNLIFAQSNYKSIYNDPANVDQEYPPTMQSLSIESYGSNLNGLIYLANGKGPHQTVIILHGFPGFEKNMDLAQVLRREGYNTVVFHYRGSWGSEGEFTLANVVEDVHSVIAYFRIKENAEKYRVDSDNIILIGHSMGGFAALMGAQADDKIKKVASIAGANIGGPTALFFKTSEGYETGVRMLGAELGPLKGTSGEELASDILKNEEEWNLLNFAGKLAKKDVLLIGASNDQAVPLESHHKPLYEEIKKINSSNVAEAVLDTEHSFSSKRIELAKTIINWLKKRP